MQTLRRRRILLASQKHEVNIYKYIYAMFLLLSLLLSVSLFTRGANPGLIRIASLDGVRSLPALIIDFPPKGSAALRVSKKET